jgi:hypothetical protein
MDLRGLLLEKTKTGSNTSTDAENEDDDHLSYNVPDPDFHDFDKNRTEEC